MVVRNSGGARDYATVADARAEVVPFQNNDKVYIEGLGEFDWKPLSTKADDGVNVIKITAIATGRLEAIEDGGTLVTNTQTTHYTLQISDNAKRTIVVIDSVAPVNVTLSGLIAGMSCKVVQRGLGQITFIAGTLTPRNNFGFFRSAGQHAIVEINVVGNDGILTGHLS